MKEPGDRAAQNSRPPRDPAGPARDRFHTDELSAVLALYDLPPLQSVQVLAAGSRRAPKALLTAATGERYVLKRRRSGPDDVDRARLTHRILRHLAAHQIPVPRIIPPRDAAESLVVMSGSVYELFAYIDAERHDRSLAQTHAAGAMLAAVHHALKDFPPDPLLEREPFHDSDRVRNGLVCVPTAARSHDSVAGKEAELLSLAEHLHERYDEAADVVRRLGYDTWSTRVTHGDWHPGNLLFHRRAVCGVLDLDSARVASRVLDIANGMLQFSLVRSAGLPEDWPDFLDLARMRRFLNGYTRAGGLRPEQRRALPHLMVESLIAECVFPIAATGSLGANPGFGVLKMIRRKLDWLGRARSALSVWLEA